MYMYITRESNKIQFTRYYNIGFKTYTDIIEIMLELPIALDLIKKIVEYNSYCKGCCHKYCRITPF